MLILQTLQSLAMLFLLMIPGFVFQKKKILNEQQNMALNAFVANVTWPCMVIDAMQISFDRKILENCGHMLLKMLIVFVLIGGGCLWIAKKRGLSKTTGNLCAFMMIFGNTAFIGMPIIEALYGSEALFYASVIEAVNDILIFTVGMVLMQKAGNAEVKLNLKEFYNPCFIASVIAILLFLFQISLPEVIGHPIRLLSNATAPVAMSVLGYQLASISLSEILGDLRCYFTVFGKIIFLPLITMAVVWLLPGVELIDKTLILDMGMPVAVMSVLLSQRYGADVQLATKSVLLSSIGLMVTAPIFAVLAELLIG